MKNIFIILFIFFLFPFNLIAKEITNSDVLNNFEDPVFNNLWFGLYDNQNIKYGWFHVNEYKENDSWVYFQEYETKYLETIEDNGELLENKIDTSMIYMEYYDLKPPFALKKIEYKLYVNEDEETFLATIKNKKVYVNVINDGNKNSFTKENFKITYPDIFKAELLLKKYDNWIKNEEISYKSFSESNFEISTEVDIIENIYSEYIKGVYVDVLNLKTKTSETRAGFTSLYLKNGIPIKYIDTYSVSKLESEEEAKNISYGGVTFEDEIITIDKYLTDKEWIKRLVFEIVGDYDGGFDTVDRQKIYTKNGKTYLELDYNIYSTDKISENEKKKNLQPTSLYPSNDPYFINLAKDIIGDTEDSTEKVMLLLDYVDKFIDDNYISNPLSVYDIMEQKSGDCSEHALLFNTLARAAGIPSREITGLINYEGYKFGLHAWNEVFMDDGYWYQADASHNYFRPPLTHIKFEHLKDVPSTYSFKLIEIEYFDEYYE